jgi:hypothetical protein
VVGDFAFFRDFRASFRVEVTHLVDEVCLAHATTAASTWESDVEAEMFVVRFFVFWSLDGLSLSLDVTFWGDFLVLFRSANTDPCAHSC